MKELFNKIKASISNVIYMANATECIPVPVNTDTASMEFVEWGGYTVGFAGKINEEERNKAVAILKFGSDVPSVAQLRKVEYPPLEDFANAYYWSQRGDNKPMENILRLATPWRRNTSHENISDHPAIDIIRL